MLTDISNKSSAKYNQIGILHASPERRLHPPTIVFICSFGVCFAVSRWPSVGAEATVVPLFPHCARAGLWEQCWGIFMLVGRAEVVQSRSQWRLRPHSVDVVASRQGGGGSCRLKMKKNHLSASHVKTLGCQTEVNHLPALGPALGSACVPAARRPYLLGPSDEAPRSANPEQLDCLKFRSTKVLATWFHWCFGSTRKFLQIFSACLPFARLANKQTSSHPDMP